MLSFLCPCCHQRLAVSSALAGIAGPCPACARVIRAPHANEVSPLVIGSQPITDGQGGPANGAWDSTGSAAEEPEVPRYAAGELGFRAVMRIAPIPAEGLDDSWRERHQRDSKLSRRRRRRHRFIENLVESRTSRKLQRIGILLLSGILGVTIMVLYLNRRSGGALLEKVFGK